MTTFGLSASHFEEYVANNNVGNGAGRRLLKDLSTVRARYADVWDDLDEKKRRQILDDNLIPHEVILQYEKEPQRSLPFKTKSVFPRQIQASGLKKVLVEDTGGSQGDLDSATSSSYTFQDEHSAPFTWRTKSQQDLAFEAGSPALENVNMDQEDLLVSTPAKVLSRPNSTLARYSRGNPCFAKAVAIPQIPTNSQSNSNSNSNQNTLKRNNNSSSTTKIDHSGRHVPAEKINNFVYQSSPNRLVLDFGDLKLDENNEPIYDNVNKSADNEDQQHQQQQQNDSVDSGKSRILSKVKKSFSTRRRRKSATPDFESKDKNKDRKNGEIDLSAEYSAIYANPATLKQQHKQQQQQQKEPIKTQDTNDTKRLSMGPGSSGTLGRIVKPSVAPPPPPVSQAPYVVPQQKQKQQQRQQQEKQNQNPPSPIRKAPVPPPTYANPSPVINDTEESVKMRQNKPSPPKPPTRKSSILNETKDSDSADEFGDFNVDLHTEADLPKTGFDFLDNW